MGHACPLGWGLNENVLKRSSRDLKFMKVSCGCLARLDNLNVLLPLVLSVFMKITFGAMNKHLNQGMAALAAETNIEFLIFVKFHWMK